MTRLCIVVAVSLLAATLAVGSAEPVAAASCGEWRWPMKTLSDKARRRATSRRSQRPSNDSERRAGPA